MLLPRPVAFCIFAIVLLSYAAQSEFAQLIQRTYKKPVFLLYLTHSGYLWIAPIHLVAIKIFGIDSEALRMRLHEAVSRHCDFRAATRSWAISDEGATATSPAVPVTPWRDLVPAFVQMILVVTLSITVPALSWYCAVPLTSMTDITALYNSNAFWAYLLAIYLTKTETMEWRKGLAVVLACLGVMIIAYGDAHGTSDEQFTIGGRLLGSLLALFGSVTYAFYEVYYSRFIALEEGPVVVAPTAAAPGHRRSLSGRPLMASPRHSRTGYSNLPDDDRHDGDAIEVVTRSPTSLNFKLPAAVHRVSDQAVYLAYANLVTASIGLCTLLLLWIALPILHVLGIETFVVPPRNVWLPIMGVVGCGVGYNAGFMILLGEWGPIVASVGNLCTLVLVATADVLLVGVEITLWTVLGSTLIVSAFAVLAADTLRG